VSRSDFEQQLVRWRRHLHQHPETGFNEIATALQTVVARSIDPGQPAVLSCTEFITDGTRNVTPTHGTIRGDTRSYSTQVQATLERRIRDISAGICRAYGATCEVDYTHEFAPTINWPDCADAAIAAASAVIGAGNVDGDVTPVMATEDFGAFLRVLPGAFVFIGNGDNGVSLHNAGYDFNDEILAVDARFLAEIARSRLRAGTGLRR
jgi:metal-dependent amidase/aminoacylase/carboxypeptidase family protein